MPSDGATISLFEDVTKNKVASLEITVREFVELGPTLWDELSALLDDRMEPGKDEEHLHLVGVLASVLWGHISEGSHEVVLHAGWRLVSNLQTGLKQDRRELLMRFTREPQTEVGVRCQHLELLFED